MEKNERITFLLLLVLSIGFFATAAVNMYMSKRRIAMALRKYDLAAVPVQVIGAHPDFKGDPRSPYTLVEFGDYECPPCRAANAQLPAILNKFRGRLRFTFRNLPLTEIHPAAMPAALAAEAARNQGMFWRMHDRLYASPDASLDVATVKVVVKALPLDRPRFQSDSSGVAKQVVAADVNEAQMLGVHSTPTFVLCYPNGRVLRLESLSQVESAMSN